MKSKFLAGLIATLVSIIVVVGLSVFLALVLDIEPSKNWFTVTAAFATIGTWLGVYKWLKPKGDVETDKYGFEIEPEVKQIDESTFIETYLKSVRKGLNGGVFLTIIGLPGTICILIFVEEMDTTAIVGLVFLILFGLFGSLALFVALKKRAGIKNGTDPLVNAIRNNISDHVIWFHGVVTSQSGNPYKEFQGYSIVIYSKELKKAVHIIAKNEMAHNEILQFLGERFPSAETGYDEATKQRMKEQYGFKGFL